MLGCKIVNAVVMSFLKLTLLVHWRSDDSHYRYSGAQVVACTYFSSSLPSIKVVTHGKSRPQPHATKREPERLSRCALLAG
jgi:hypothetical protein